MGGGGEVEEVQEAGGGRGGGGSIEETQLWIWSLEIRYVKLSYVRRQEVEEEVEERWR
jgi:hypothetical protein